MSPTAPVTLHLLTPDDLPLMRALTKALGEIFEEEDVYSGSPPSDEWILGLLRDPHFIAMAAVKEGEVAGGLAGYVLPKFEQERSEIFIYDLGVREEHRRQGIALALLREMGRVAKEKGAWAVFIQADADNEPAIALYSKLGPREDAVHFDIWMG
jgi:aminoglycoside 3-N-acetyltransferase I